MKSITKLVLFLAALMMLASCSGGKKSAVSSVVAHGDEADNSKTGIGDDNNIGSLPDADKQEIIETVKDQLITQFQDSDQDVEDIIETDGGAIDPQVAELIDMNLDSDTIVNLLAEHFNLDPGTIPDLGTTDGGTLDEDQLMEILKEQYPEADLDNLFNVDMDGLTGGEDNDMLDAIMNANLDDPTSFLDLLTGAFGS